MNADMLESDIIGCTFISHSYDEFDGRKLVVLNIEYGLPYGAVRGGASDEVKMVLFTYKYNRGYNRFHMELSYFQKCVKRYNSKSKGGSIEII